MKIKIRYLMLAIVLGLLTSCATYQAQLGMTKSFDDLQKAGKLPGIPAGKHGTCWMPHFDQHGNKTYPVTMVLAATIKGDSSRYIYTFTKDNESSEWRLTAAWRSFPDGKHEDLMVK